MSRINSFTRQNKAVKRYQTTFPGKQQNYRLWNRRQTVPGRGRRKKVIPRHWLPGFPATFLCDNAPDGGLLSCYYPDNMTVMEEEVPQVSAQKARSPTVVFHEAKVSIAASHRGERRPRFHTALRSAHCRVCRCSLCMWGCRRRWTFLE